MATPRAAREFDTLPQDQVPRYLELFRRIIADDPRVEYKKLAVPQASAYRVPELWEAKANRKYRLFLSSMSRPMTIIGFGHRGEHAVFRRER